MSGRERAASVDWGVHGCAQQHDLLGVLMRFIRKVRSMRAGRYTVVVRIGDVTLKVPLRIS